MIHELVLRSSVKVHPFFKMAPLLFKPFVLISGNLFPYGPGLEFSKASGYSNISHAMPNHPDTAIYAMPCQSIRIQQYMPCHAKSSGYSNISHAMPNHPDTAIYAMPCQIMLFHFFKLGLGIRSMVFCTNRSFFKQKERIALSFALFERANRSFCTFIKSD